MIKTIGRIPPSALNDWPMSAAAKLGFHITPSHPGFLDLKFLARLPSPTAPAPCTQTANHPTIQPLRRTSGEPAYHQPAEFSRGPQPDATSALRKVLLGPQTR